MIKSQQLLLSPLLTMSLEECPPFCPICGDDSTSDISSRLSSGVRIFQSFLKLFGASSWNGGNFGFCDLCKMQLLLISQLQQDLVELEKKLEKHEKNLREKLEGSEVNFQKNSVYSKDQRYLKLRRQLVGGAIGDEEAHRIKVEVEDPLENDGNDPRNMLDLEYILPLSHSEEEEDSPPPRSKRHRAPPQRFSPAVEKVIKKKAQIKSTEEESENDNAPEQDDYDSDSEISPPSIEALVEKGKKPSLPKQTISIYKIRLTKVPTSDSYQCSACSLILPNNINKMRSHVAKEHTNLFVCPHCDKRFDRPTYLRAHVDYHHKNLPPEVTCHCTICQKPFSRPYRLRDHLWTHYSEVEKAAALSRGEKPPRGILKTFQCSEEGCGRKFGTMSKLDKHIQEFHLKVAPEKKLCGICGASVTNLLNHTKLKHSSYEERRYQCLQCDKKFVFTMNLRQHQRQVHGTETPWSCEHCGKGFKIKTNWMEHQKTHENDKSFCDLCGASFKSSQSLKPYEPGS
ncbi:Zinc finger and SCAN domain-containing protein 2 [Orchesella cincta]|uniref:Zinc finger and SCAN domain-containing protein 2 n=1 Tax=Orchesella cincta TaxID=48709 RepID=A0A1D2MDV7_ORCCI|nr:Zinc finger and SCAN domain-containing protein 2 [Orchesella cincta]